MGPPGPGLGGIDLLLRLRDCAPGVRDLYVLGQNSWRIVRRVLKNNMTYVALDLLKCYSRITLTNVSLNVEDRKEAFGSLVARLVAHVAGEKQEPYVIEFL